MAELTTQCPCAKRMRLPPRLEGETQPPNGTIVVCAYCERVGVASTREAYSRPATRVEINGARTELERLRNEAHERYPKRRRRPLPRAVAVP